jgi:hypothetical protein
MLLTEKTIHFLQSISFIYKDLQNGWVQILCPFCDDSTRKNSKISHGHFYLSKTFNYCNCFRCDYSNSLSKALISLGFNDKDSLKILTQNNTNNFYYFKNKLDVANSRDIAIHPFLEDNYQSFKEQYPNEFKQFLEYIYTRCYSIDPIKHLIQPVIKDSYLMASFYNFNGQKVTSRFITPHPKYRYMIEPNKRNYYFFQDIYNISDYDDIVICEGVFDLINLYRYYDNLNNAFFIAIGGKQFRKILKELLSNYLLIGNYRFNIILDNDLNFKPTKLINSCTDIIQQLNPHSSANFYIPNIYKDVSDLMQLEKI